MTTVQNGALAGLDFTDAAWQKAEGYRHSADLYEGIEPAGKNGEYLVDQVDDVEAARQAAVGESEEEPATPPALEDLAKGNWVKGSGGVFAPAETVEIIVGAWKGIPNYECPLCSYKSLDSDRVVEHVWRVHRKTGELPE